MSRIGLFGGSFDPPHNAHIAVAKAVLESQGLDRVDLLVSNKPPHAKGKQVIADVKHRREMARLAVANETGLGVEDCETRREGKSYTIDTIRELQALHPDTGYTFIIGGDMLADLPRWREIHELATRVHFVPVFRPGYTDEVWQGLREDFDQDFIARLQANVLEMPLIDISSTKVREAVASGESIAEWVAPGVEAYIRAHRLYAH
jgi:nicotinate-nucleotide adenylyltransferase